MKNRKSGRIVNFSTYSGYMPSINNEKRIEVKKEKIAKIRKTRKKNRKNNFKVKFFLLLLLVIAIICVCLFTPLFNLSNINIIYSNEIKAKQEMVENVNPEAVEDKTDNIITVENDNYSKYTNSEIINMSGIIIGNNLFREDLSKAKKEIEKAPYVKEAKLVRKFPNEILIYIEERSIKAYIDYVGSYICIDESGYIVDSIKKEEKKDKIPIVNGMKPSSVINGFMVGTVAEVDDPIKLQRIVNLLNLIEKNELKLDISNIDISDKDNLLITIENGDKIINFGDMSNMNGKIMYLDGILKDTKNKKGTIIMNSSEDNLKPIFSENIGG